MEVQRQTKQRETILNIFRAAGGPLSVDDLLTRARQLLPQLGTATLYRALKRLQQADLIRAVELPGEAAHYELTDRRHHHHFQCVECGRWFRLERCFVALPAGTVLPEGFVVEGHYLALYGRCANCAAEPAGLPPGA